jgi:hypothetical protein
MDGLIEGRIVHYVLPAEQNCKEPGAHRPAIVVRVCPPEWYPPSEGRVNLQVFTDFENDYPKSDGHIWATSVGYDPDKAPGTWHWIEKA